MHDCSPVNTTGPVLVYVEDRALPRGHDWAALEVDGERLVLIKLSAATPETLVDAYEGARLLDS
jgi:hypothetical protein